MEPQNSVLILFPPNTFLDFVDKGNPDSSMLKTLAGSFSASNRSFSEK